MPLTTTTKKTPKPPYRIFPKYKTFVPYHKRRAKNECDFVNIQMKLERKQFAELN